MLLWIRGSSFSYRSIQSPSGSEEGWGRESRRGLLAQKEIFGTAGRQWASPGKPAWWFQKQGSR